MSVPWAIQSVVFCFASLADWYTIPWTPPLFSCILSRLQQRQFFVCGKPFLNDPSGYGTQPPRCLSIMSLPFYLSSQYDHLMLLFGFLLIWTPWPQDQAPLIQWCLFEYFVKLIWLFERAGYVHYSLSLLAMKNVNWTFWKIYWRKNQEIKTFRAVNWFVREWWFIWFVNICKTKIK